MKIKYSPGVCDTQIWVSCVRSIEGVSMQKYGCWKTTASMNEDLGGLGAGPRHIAETSVSQSLHLFVADNKESLTGVST